MGCKVVCRGLKLRKFSRCGWLRLVALWVYGSSLECEGEELGVRQGDEDEEARLVVEGEVKAVEGEEVDDGEEQLRIVSLVCDAVDHEVQSRSATIMAISDGHMTSASVQLQLMMSKFPEHIRKMPVKKFRKQHYPNTEPNTRSNGTLRFDLVQGPAFQPPGESTLGVSTGFSSTFECSQQ